MEKRVKHKKIINIPDKDLGKLKFSKYFDDSQSNKNIRKIMDLHYNWGYKWRDVARKMGMSIYTIHQYAGIGRDQLRKRGSKETNLLLRQKTLDNTKKNYFSGNSLLRKNYKEYRKVVDKNLDNLERAYRICKARCKKKKDFPTVDGWRKFWRSYRTMQEKKKRAKKELEFVIREKKKKYSEEEAWKKGLGDPAFFSDYFLDIELNDWQKKWLRRTMLSDKNVLVPGNQVGKTLITAVKHIWRCYYKTGYFSPRQKFNRKYVDDPNIEYPTLNLSPILQQARQCYQYILDILQSRFIIRVEDQIYQNACQIKDFLLKPKAVPSPASLSYKPIEFKNGSTCNVASTAGDQASGLAGRQFTYISYDECSLSKHLGEELPGRIQSRLIRYGGDLDLVGTPDSECSSRQYYLQIVKKGLALEDGWYAQTGKLDDNKFIPKINKEKLKKQIKSTDPRLYRQVVFGEFVEGTSKTFLPKAVGKLFDENIEYEDAQPGHSYVIGVDWALSVDYTVMIVMDYSVYPYRIVNFLRYKGNEKSPSDQYSDLMMLKANYNDAEVVMDSTSLGGKIIEHDLRDMGAYGYNFGPGKKKGFIQTMKTFLYSREQKIISPLIPQLEEELSIYEIDDKGLTQDSVMAFGLCLYYIEQEEDYSPTSSQSLNINSALFD